MITAVINRSVNDTIKYMAIHNLDTSRLKNKEMTIRTIDMNIKPNVMIFKRLDMVF